MAETKTAGAATALQMVKPETRIATPTNEPAPKPAGETRLKAVPTAPLAEPVKTTPVQATPVKATPVKATPVKATPVKASPVKASPVKKAPTKTAPAKTARAKTSAPGKAKAAVDGGNGLEALVTAGQDNLAACMTCGTIVAKGLETLGNEVMTLTRANLDANWAATRSLMAAKSPRELVDVQTSFARDRLEDLANEAAKIGALTMNVATEALESLQDRFDANARTVLRPFGL